MTLGTLVTLSREGYDRIVALGAELQQSSPFPEVEMAGSNHEQVVVTIYLMQALAICNYRLPDETVEQTILRLIQNLVDEAELKTASAVDEFLARAMGNKRPI